MLQLECLLYASMFQGCCEDACKNASNMHQGYFQDAKPYDCPLSQLPSPNEGLVLFLSGILLGPLTLICDFVCVSSCVIVCHFVRYCVALCY